MGENCYLRAVPPAKCRAGLSLSKRHSAWKGRHVNCCLAAVPPAKCRAGLSLSKRHSAWKGRHANCCLRVWDDSREFYFEINFHIGPRVIGFSFLQGALPPAPPVIGLYNHLADTHAHLKFHCGSKENFSQSPSKTVLLLVTSGCNQGGEGGEAPFKEKRKFIRGINQNFVKIIETRRYSYNAKQQFLCLLAFVERRLARNNLLRHLGAGTARKQQVTPS